MSQESELSALPARTPTAEPLKAILRFLPNHVVDALEGHADPYGLSDTQVLELAIVNLLALDTTSFADLGKLKPMSQLAEENAILKARIQALGQDIKDVLAVHRQIDLPDRPLRVAFFQESDFCRTQCPHLVLSCQPLQLLHKPTQSSRVGQPEGVWYATR